MAAAAISVDQAILIPTARKQNTGYCLSRYGKRQSLITGGAAANAICRREGHHVVIATGQPARAKMHAL
jgi:hypothetical protein